MMSWMLSCFVFCYFCVFIQTSKSYFLLCFKWLYLFISCIFCFFLINSTDLKLNASMWIRCLGLPCKNHTRQWKKVVWIIISPNVWLQADLFVSYIQNFLFVGVTCCLLSPRGSEDCGCRWGVSVPPLVCGPEFSCVNAERLAIDAGSTATIKMWADSLVWTCVGALWWLYNVFDIFNEGHMGRLRYTVYINTIRV